MKKIGFIDYYLSEWHANNYPAWIRECCEKNGLEYEIAYAWGEEEVSLRDGKTNTQWCQENGVTMCSTIEECCEKSDVLLILAPSTPEKHLPYAKIALSYGKPTYIDKTFAPNLAEAKEILSIAAKYGTPVFSTSALRYADELKEFAGARALITTGGGRAAEEYIVHQLEMIVKTMGCGATSVCATAQGDQRIYRVLFGDGRAATAIYAPALSFTLCGEMENGASVSKSVSSEFFKTLMEKILYFYEGEKPDFSQEETLEVMRLREALLTVAEKSQNTVISL